MKLLYKGTFTKYVNKKIIVKNVNFIVNVYKVENVNVEE